MAHRQDPAIEPGETADPEPPRVWLLSGYRAGERTQMTALAEALGWPFAVKDLALRPWDFVPGLMRRRTLLGVDTRRSSPLVPPWPDIVISAGMRHEPVARWIREQSGGHCRLVLVGRPWAAYREFDLIITTPQYRLPERLNILQNNGTLHGVSPASLAAAAARWRGEFDHLPKPFTGLLVGGNSGPYTLGPGTAARLGAEASQMVRRNGGSLLVTTSARTSAQATDALVAALDCPSHVHRWTPDPGQNPYLGILALAEDLIVTCDSVSMLSEAAAAGKRLWIFDLGHSGDGDFRLGASAYRLLMRYGHPRLTRDLAPFHRRLVELGLATWLNQAPASRPSGAPADLARAVARVRQLAGARPEARGRRGT